jgi:hypothetical protein
VMMAMFMLLAAAAKIYLGRIYEDCTDNARFGG